MELIILKMKIRNLLLALLIMCVSFEAFSYGRLGHDAIAYIAECHLNPKTKKIVESYLDGKSIVYYSVWMDEVRATPKFKHSTKWHTGMVNEDFKPYMGTNFKEGENINDVCYHLTRLIGELENYKEMDDSTVTVALKMIIHLVGDLHCPGHVKYDDVNEKFDVTFMGRPCSYHSVWDDGLLAEVHKWSFLEFGHQLDRLSKKEIKAIQEGTPEEWFEENAKACKMIYDLASPGAKLGKDFYMAARPLADSQVQKAGYRLAKVLNDIFR